jgi:Zn-dependent protease with chaperone function
MLALVGIVHPRLLITRSVVAALTPAELAASLAHEMEHSSSWDNLKRLLIRASPDLLAWTATARTIERRWAAASEHNADRRAAADGPAARCALASALVKIARMMTLAASTPTKGKAESFWGRRGEPICTLVDGGDITTRVERLLADAAPASDRRLTTTAVGVGIAGAIACTTVYAPLLRIVHTATEILVNSLP